MLTESKTFREAEFRVDCQAARVTRNSLVPAMALLEVYVHGLASHSMYSAGVGLGRSFLIERIERLPALAREERP